MADKAATTFPTHDGDNSTSLLNRRAAAEFLRSQGFPVAVATLASLVSRGGGPRYQKFGQRVLYQGTELLTWAEMKLSPPRSNSSEGVPAQKKAAEASL